jgi:tryptophan synthase alpha chain
MTGVIRSQTDLPIAVGFGISNPEQARQVANCSDAIVVGSAIVNQIAEHSDTPEMPKQVAEYVKTLVEAIK